MVGGHRRRTPYALRRMGGCSRARGGAGQRAVAPGTAWALSPIPSKQATMPQMPQRSARHPPTHNNHLNTLLRRITILQCTAHHPLGSVGGQGALGQERVGAPGQGVRGPACDDRRSGARRAGAVQRAQHAHDLHSTAGAPGQCAHGAKASVARHCRRALEACGVRCQWAGLCAMRAAAQHSIHSITRAPPPWQVPSWIPTSATVWLSFLASRVLA